MVRFPGIPCIYRYACQTKTEYFGILTSFVFRALATYLFFSSGWYTNLSIPREECNIVDPASIGSIKYRWLPFLVPSRLLCPFGWVQSWHLSRYLAPVLGSFRSSSFFCFRLSAMGILPIQKSITALALLYFTFFFVSRRWKRCFVDLHLATISYQL